MVRTSSRWSRRPGPLRRHRLRHGDHQRRDEGLRRVRESAEGRHRPQHVLRYSAQFNRTTAPRVPSSRTPAVLFDKATQRWYADVLTLEVYPDTGNFTGQNHLASRSARVPARSGSGRFTAPTSPTTARTVREPWLQYRPDPAAPTHPFGCIGDYPTSGPTPTGIYLTTNEYALFGPEFHGAQVYAYSSGHWAQHAPPSRDPDRHTRMDHGNSGFTLWPAVATGQQQNARGGTEYFLSSNAADEAHGNGTAVGPRTSTQLLVWNLTNTRSLNGDEPELDLSHSYLHVGRYSTPPASSRRSAVCRWSTASTTRTAQHS